jgi:hypothetical protein
MTFNRLTQLIQHQTNHHTETRNSYGNSIKTDKILTTKMSSNPDQSTQTTQYNAIGTKYNTIKTLPAVEPEKPSIIKALGNIEGKRCLGPSSPFNSPVSVSFQYC